MSDEPSAESAAVLLDSFTVSETDRALVELCTVILTALALDSPQKRSAIAQLLDASATGLRQGQLLKAAGIVLAVRERATGQRSPAASFELFSIPTEGIA